MANRWNDMSTETDSHHQHHRHHTHHGHGSQSRESTHRARRRQSVHTSHAVRPSPSSFASVTSTARAAPMAIGGARVASPPPPPLPPPPIVKDMEEGYDLGWQFSNRGHSHALNLAPAASFCQSRPASSHRRDSDDSDYGASGHRDSWSSPHWPPSTKDLIVRGGSITAGSGTGSAVPTDEGYGSLSGSSLSNTQLVILSPICSAFIHRPCNNIYGGIRCQWFCHGRWITL